MQDLCQMTLPSKKKRVNGLKYEVAEWERGFVMGQAMLRVPNQEIAEYLGITPKTLRKHFSEELKALSKAKTKLISTAFDVATKERNVAMIIFLLKTMCCMSEKNITEIVTRPNIEISFKPAIKKNATKRKKSN